MGTAVTDPLVGRLVDGRYEVVSRIARGGMATVYLAVDRRLDRDVALKVMHPHLAEGSSGADFVARFRREARAAARLTHPGLVAVFDQGVDGETSYLTMEYVDGSNLRRRLAEQGALTVAEALRITESVLDALAAAHRGDLVHRDIKPENVLLATDGRIKLADFGLARAVTEVTSTTTGTVLGTVAYLAPELVVRGASDARTDVYACGILLFEMLTGRQPFVGETPIQVAYQHVNSDLPAPSDDADWLPVEIDDLVRALAARDADDRPVDAAAAVGLLRRARAELDDATLARRADVAPSIVLPAATDPDETPLPDDERTESDDRSDDRSDEHADGSTVRIADLPRGSTVALPIGLGGPRAVTPRAITPATPPPPPPPARRARRRLLAAVLAVLVALGLGGAGWWYVAAGPGAYTTVPEIAGTSAEAARAALHAVGLESTTTSEFSSDVDKGLVVTSVPAPGDKVRKDGTVEVTISKGPDYVDLPDGVVGALQADAEAALVDADLEVDYADPVYDDKAGLGVVVSAVLPDGTSAKAGERTVRHTVVTLTTSKGPAPVTITSQVGADAKTASKQLKEDGLKVRTTEEFSSTVKAGAVIRQSPEGGTKGHRGDTVTLVVSKGPELFEVPNVMRNGIGSATDTLKAAGFEVEVRHAATYFGLGFVVGQEPGGGSMHPKGTVIVLTIT
ncbi:Stk1 family PASTA domain-containing Ser/Thr kinase [Cellulomonas palmilytica]|uniref:Stk1 family PASTA domain-containing Ser/Thr kinase n=1 Tax=Cellulomonas palmilytica TaxID=2608402 RepID=UPI001F40FC46|nr:Stk1 family PASTA domain-containing Ser/Thr kinase [Cellulomonas palmilytica]UJP39207.1 Stk1 family PASTA domain-containing Ser/Thr kinase [Cellulomonas palmilytica]